MRRSVVCAAALEEESQVCDRLDSIAGRSLVSVTLCGSVKLCGRELFVCLLARSLSERRLPPPFLAMAVDPTTGQIVTFQDVCDNRSGYGVKGASHQDWVSGGQSFLYVSLTEGTKSEDGCCRSGCFGGRVAQKSDRIPVMRLGVNGDMDPKHPSPFNVTPSPVCKRMWVDSEVLDHAMIVGDKEHGTRGLSIPVPEQTIVGQQVLPKVGCCSALSYSFKTFVHMVC